MLKKALLALASFINKHLGHLSTTRLQVTIEEAFPEPKEIPAVVRVFRTTPDPEYVIGRFSIHRAECEANHDDRCNLSCAVRDIYVFGRQIGFMEGRHHFFPMEDAKPAEKRSERDGS